VTPGHVFPLRARRGGVLVRAGQTEGSVDLARLAGLGAAGVICEIMNDDGTMARMPDLEASREARPLILTIADLIQYRLQTERLVRRVAERTLRLDLTPATGVAARSTR
jgi:3,4-dihydroxy 2-butanone 4-phosphate synthase/GTP cyclohydrolase II